MKSLFAKKSTHLNASSLATNKTNIFLLFLLAIIVFTPLLSVGFTTNDDAEIANSLLSVWKGINWSIIGQGRITFLWGYPALRLPYFFDNQYYYLFVKCGSFLLVFSALIFCMRSIFESVQISFLTIFFFLILVQNGWEHNGLTSYPFAFNFYVISFLYSLGFFSLAIKRQNIFFAYVSSILYFLALGSELFVLFYSFYIALALSGAHEKTYRDQFLIVKKYISIITITLLSYLSLYFVFRILFPSNYDGNVLGSIDFSKTIDVILTYSLNAFPLESFRFILNHYQPILPPHQNILSLVNTSNIIKALISGFVFYRLLDADKPAVLNKKFLWFGAFWSFLGVFLPNILLGFVSRHQEWVSVGVRSYLYTYYSFISAVVFLSLLTALLCQKCTFYPKWARYLMLCISTLFVVALTFIVDLRNTYIAADQKLSGRKWQLMQELTKSKVFSEVQNGAVILSPTLENSFRGYVATTDQYWINYIERTTGKKVKFNNKACEIGKDCYVLFYKQKDHSDGQYIVFGKVDDYIKLTSSGLTVFSISNDNNKLIMGSFDINNEMPRIEINDQLASNYKKGFFVYGLKLKEDGSFITIYKLGGNVSYFADQITFSNYDLDLHLSPVSIDIGDGFYDWENGDIGQPMWAWGRSSSSLKIMNYDAHPVNATINFEVKPIEPISLKVEGKGNLVFDLTPASNRFISFPITLPHGVTILNLNASKPSIQASPADKRLISYSIRNLQINFL